MTPLPPPDELLKSKWDTWQKLQDNGLFSYTNAPELNLSVGPREDALAFKAFCQLSGVILDVGCGPQTYPSYLPGTGAVVGIDPLLGQQPRGFAFVQGIGEYLPFRDGTFDHILYATSLDHMLVPRHSLAESTRCLKPGGCLNLWLDSQAATYEPVGQSRFKQVTVLAKKGFKSLSRHGWMNKMGLRRTLSYMGSVAKMKVPQGAIDYFHFEHLTLEVVTRWLDELNLVIGKQQEYPLADSLFIQAKRQ